MKDTLNGRSRAITPKCTGESWRDADALAETLARCATAPSISALQSLTLEALEAGLGFRAGTFFLANLDGEEIATEQGFVRGLPSESLEIYTASFARSDIFASSRARSLLERFGAVSFDELSGDLTLANQRYVTHFMEPFGIRAQVSAFVETGLPLQGVLSVMSSERGRFGGRERSVLISIGGIVGSRLRELVLHSPRTNAHSNNMLSSREREVASLAAEGYNNAAIARRLAISIDTVKKHLASVFRKTGVANRTQLSLRLRPDSPADPPIRSR